MTRKLEKSEKKYQSPFPPLIKKKSELIEVIEKKPKIEIKEKKNEIIIKEIKKFPDVDFRDKKIHTKKKSLEEIESGMHSEIETEAQEFSPSLEKIANAPRLISSGKTQTASRKEQSSFEKTDEFSYVPKKSEESVKYIQGSMEHVEMPRNFNPDNVRTRFNDIASRKVGFVESEASRIAPSANYETYTPVKVKELQEDMQNVRDRSLKKAMKYESPK